MAVLVGPDAPQVTWLPAQRWHGEGALLASSRGETGSTGSDLHLVSDGIHLCAGEAPDLPRDSRHHATIVAFARDVALHALQACQANMGLAQWLHLQYPDSTVPPRPEVVAQTVVAATFDPAIWASLAAAGDRHVKVKWTSADPKELAEFVAMVRANGLQLRLDVNGGWQGRPPADLAALLEAAQGVEYVEDPTAVADWPNSSAVPLAADLLDSSPESVLALAARGAVAVAVVKPALLGSIGRFLQFAQALSKLSCDLVISSLFDGPVGRSALHALAAVAPGRLRACGLGVPGQPAGQLRMSDNLPTLQMMWRMSDGLARAARYQPDRLALRDADRNIDWTWKQLDAQGHAIARLISQAGVLAGEIVAAWADDAALLLPAQWAAWRLGAVWLPIHPRATTAEVDELLARTRPRVLLTDRRHPHAHGLVIAPEQLEPSPISYVMPAMDATADALWLPTSGTTGRQKLCRISHFSLWYAVAASLDAVGATADDVWLCPLPLCHVGGLMVAARAAVGVGTLVVSSGSSGLAIHTLSERFALTQASIVGLQLQRFLQQSKDVIDSPLRCVLVGGGPVPPEWLDEGRRRGLPLRQTYGQTETCAQVAITGVADNTLHPLLGVQLRIDQPDNDGYGRLIAHTWQSMTGYAQLPGEEVQPESEVGHGWLDTGDWANLQGGALTIAARRSDIIISGGENIYPQEIETVLIGIPGIDEAIVCGVPDFERGQIVGAWLVTALRPEQCWPLLEQALGRVAPYKRPLIWRFCPEPLARTGPGKIARGEMSMQFANLCKSDPEELLRMRL